MIARVKKLQVCGSQQLRLWFTDGLSGLVDLGPLLRGPIFRPLASPEFFRLARVDRVAGTVVWPNGADIAPETLHELVAAGRSEVPANRRRKAARRPTRR
ncbi:MAG: DUF2442 domain-containing protein [Planctomycetota bacterium]